MRIRLFGEIPGCKNKSTSPLVRNESYKKYFIFAAGKPYFLESTVLDFRIFHPLEIS